MKGWQIFVHSLRQVTGNFKAALRISGLLYVAQTVVGVVLLGGDAMRPGGRFWMMLNGVSNPAMALGFDPAMALGFVITILVALWIAVGWHRYVLLGEAATLVPTFRSDRMLAYFLRSLGYTAILILLGAVWVGIVVFAFGSIFYDLGTLPVILIVILMYLPILVIALRITAALPAAAIGVVKPFWSGWAATAGGSADLAVLAVVYVVILRGPDLIGDYVFGTSSVLYAIWSFVVGWLQMMIGVSILTTLYGHYIEKRPLVWPGSTPPIS